MNQNRCLITGASGLVGGCLFARMEALGHPAIGLSRSPRPGSRLQQAPSLSANADWGALVEGMTVVVHAAARVHVMHDTSADPLAEFRAVNVEGTLALARQAASAGVRRFVFISSIKVNGEVTAPGKAFTAEDMPAPRDPYGISKMEAEQGLVALASGTGMELVVVRPPLVYGPGVKANFEAMMRWLKREIPLPLGAIDNRRTLVALDNLVDLVVTCIEHPAAMDQVFLAGDGEDLSTTDLLRRLAVALHVRARLLPVPPRALEAAAALFGKRPVAQRLCGNLQLDISKATRLLGWRPPVSVDEGLSRTAAHFLEHQNR